MIVLYIIVGVIVVSVSLGAWYDHRGKWRGWRVGASTEEAFQHRMDVKSIHNPMVQGGKQDWMTWRQRNQK
jgi:hypothetical protein